MSSAKLVPSNSPNSALRIEIRNAKLSDIDRLISIRRAAWLSTYVNDSIGITSSFLVCCLNNERDQSVVWRQYIRSRQFKIFVAVVDDGIVAYCCVKRGKVRNEIVRLYVDTKFKYFGIGSNLLGQSIDWLGVDQPICVKVVSYNKIAIRFYEKFGFYYVRDILEEADVTPTGDDFFDIEMVRPAGSTN